MWRHRVTRFRNSRIPKRNNFTEINIFCLERITSVKILPNQIEKSHILLNELPTTEMNFAAYSLQGVDFPVPLILFYFQQRGHDLFCQSHRNICASWILLQPVSVSRIENNLLDDPYVSSRTINYTGYCGDLVYFETEIWFVGIASPWKVALDFCILSFWFCLEGSGFFYSGLSFTLSLKVLH